MIDKNTMTLKTLLEKYFLVIPDYQREYAQGRDNPRDTNVLDMFVETISNALKNGVDLSLDYVYGNIRNENGVEVFFPVDGQQRLTTLFLFYVYCYQGRDDRSFLNRFKYAVNPHTNSFIQLLLTNGAAEPEKAAEWKYWFDIMTSIHSDSCAFSLLNAYRRIQRSMKGEEIDVSKLEQISFQFLNTAESDLPESVFWKMNARGRQLTESEIFKAEVAKYIPDDEKKKEFAAGFSAFYSKIFSDLKEDLIRTDKCVMRLIKSFCQWQTSESEFGFTNYIASSEYRKAFSKNNDLYVTLPRFFKFCNKHNVKGLLPSRVLPEEEYLFERLPVRIISAMIIFFRTISLDVPDIKAKFRCWMRLSSNLIDNSQSVAALKSVLNTLSDDNHIASIETASVFDDIKCDEKDIMLTEQLKEEALKARLIAGENGEMWRCLFNKAENHKVLRGKVSILLPDGENTSSVCFDSDLDYLDKLWNGQRENYLLTRILLSNYENERPHCYIDMRCSDSNGEAAKIVIYESLSGCFRKAIENGKILDPEKLDLKGKPYWIKSLCRDGKLLIDSVARDGNVYTYYDHLVVLRNGKRIDTYGNIILDDREVFIAKLINDGAIECLDPNQQIFNKGKPTHYFKNTSVRFKYKGYFFELYYYPFYNENDIYLLEDNPNTPDPYCKRLNVQESITDDSQKYYCFRFGENPTQESIKNSMDKLIEEGIRDHVIKEKVLT